MKRLIWLALALLLVANGALAAEVKLAAKWYDLGLIEDKPGVTVDKETGDWEAGAIAAQAQLEYLGRTGLSRACLMQLIYEGNRESGLIQPVLRFDVVGEALEADAVSVLVDGVRYDMPVKNEKAKVGDRNVERISCPLTREGLALVDKIVAGGKVSLRFHGKRTYTTDIDLTYTGSEGKKKLEAGAAKCLFVDGAPDMTGYDLWDLSAKWWEAEHDFAPRMESVPFDGKLSEMVSSGSSGTRVKEMERALIDAGYLSGSADGEFNTRTRDAIKLAQKDLGLIQSGSGDARLIQLIAGGERPAKGEVQWQSEMTALGGASVGLHRYWYARRATPSIPEDPDAQTGVDNQDNLLVVLEGVLENTSERALNPKWSVKASVTLGGRTYEGSALIDSDGGRAFGSELLPMGQARLLIVCEIPPAAAAGGGEATIEIAGEQAVFTLK